MCNNELWSIEWNQHWKRFIPSLWVIWIEESSFSHIHSIGWWCILWFSFSGIWEYEWLNEWWMRFDSTSVHQSWISDPCWWLLYCWIEWVDNEEYDDWLIDWLDLPSLSTFKGVGSNLDGITKVILESDDWRLNLN